ncbi:MAG: hypothetical protein KY462_12245 [Actinobacteria bacterium]|nr:hypothetical protein [Actinomycetota bacterium]
MFAAVLALVVLMPGAAVAHPDATGDPAHDHDLDHQLETSFPRDPDAALQQQDEEQDNVVSTGPSARRGRVKNLELVGRGERLVPNATTDLWVHDRFAYLGTFNEPCGTGEGYVPGVGEVVLAQNVAEPGIPIFDVHNRHRPAYIGTIPSVEGSRINDVKVESMRGSDILVHSNEPCAGGPGGFEIYDVSDPRNPVHLAHVTTGDVNPTVVELLGTDDVGVHNLYLFRRGGRDFVAVQVEGLLANFQIFDITDPVNPQLVTIWGAEELFDPSVDWATTEDVDLILEVWQTWLAAGFGASQNRFLHDFWVSDDGMLAYLANWDAGLVRLDLTDLANPQVVSVAIDPTSEDGEVNSHSVWPSGNGRVVVEGEEDFAPFKLRLFIAEGLVGIFDAAEAAFTPLIADLPERAFEGDAVFVGLACDASERVPPGGGDDIAVAMRGACRFDEKVQNIQDAGGYQAVIIFNAPGDESVLTPGGEPRELPTIFVAHSTGLAIFGVESADELDIGMRGEPVRGEAVPDGWSGFRIWDYSDPADPVLASTFNTVCSANPLDASCDPRGVYSSHNVIVENQGNRTLAYFSWYANGVLVADVTDPYNPVEIARYNPTGDAFEEQNAGIQDVWGIFKEDNRPWIYASDRNGGLYILKLLGAGSTNPKAGGNRGSGNLSPDRR